MTDVQESESVQLESTGRWRGEEAAPGGGQVGGTRACWAGLFPCSGKSSETVSQGETQTHFRFGVSRSFCCWQEEVLGDSCGAAEPVPGS